MTRIAPLSLALILLTTALAGCLSEDDTSDLAEDTSQNSADIEAVSTELAAVSDAINTMNTELETVSDSLGSDSALIEALDARIVELENASADNTTDAQIADLKDEIATIVEVLMHLQNGVTALDADLQPELPPGVGTIQVLDDFGDVYGILMAITGDGYRYQEMQDYADYLTRELVLVKGVGKVVVGGQRQEQVLVEVQV